MSFAGNPELVDPGLDTLPSEPMPKVSECLNVARKLGINAANTLVLSTVNPDSHVSSRAVIIKSADERGLVFGTSSLSVKGQNLESNPWAAGTFYWRETIQQINLQGPVRRLSDISSDELFRSRPRDAQAIAALSLQSSSFESAEDEALLRDNVRRLFESDQVIERPSHWYAYHFAPEIVEFWYGALDRFDIRIKYERVDGFWSQKRLRP